MRQLQAITDLLYPPQCATCDARTDGEGTLCGSCWSDTAFITGTVCDLCGTPMLTDRDELPDDTPHRCDDCVTLARPWQHGRAAVHYSGTARRLILALKHGDRPELAATGARWMAQAGQPVLSTDAVLVPIPIHRIRLLLRRYNQAVQLGRRLSSETGLPCAPMALLRNRATDVQDGMTVDQRFQNTEGSIVPNGDAARVIAGRSVVLIDDVMTSGATFAAATEACISAGATHVSVLALARVVKDA